MRKSLIFIVLTVSFLFCASSALASTAETPERQAVQFKFDLSKDKKEIIPSVTVYSTDFTTGEKTDKTYIFTEMSLKVPDDLQVVVEDRDLRNNPNVGMFDFDNKSTSWNYDPIEKTPNGPKAFHVYEEWVVKWNEEDGTTLARPEIRTVLYEFDIQSHQLKLVTDQTLVPVEDNYASYSGFRSISIIQDFNAYAIHKMVNGEGQYDLYSLTNDQLLVTLPRLPFKKHYLTEVSMSNENIYYSTGEEKEGYTTELRQDGTAREVPYVSYPVRWIQNVDDGYFKGVYEDGELNYYFYNGIEESQIASSQIGTEKMEAYFSPNKKYLLIKKDELNPETKDSANPESSVIRVFDIQSQTFLNDIQPYYNQSILKLQWFSDDILYVEHYFYDASGHYTFYYHLPSGLLTMPQSEEVQLRGMSSQNKITHNFDFEHHISAADPIPVKLDDKNVVYSGQGAFKDSNMKYLVPLRDFVKSAGGSISVDHNQIQVEIKGIKKALDLYDPQFRIYNHTLFVPIEFLADAYQYLLQYRDKGLATTRNDEIKLISIDPQQFSYLSAVGVSWLNWDTPEEMIIANREVDYERAVFIGPLGNINFKYEDNKLIQVRLINDFMIGKGIKRGSSIREVQDAFGKAEIEDITVEGQDYKRMVYAIGSERLAFDFIIVDHQYIEQKDYLEAVTVEKL